MKCSPSRSGVSRVSVEGSLSGPFDARSVASSSDGATPGHRTPSRWAAFIARIYEVVPLVCPSCGGSMSMVQVGGAS